MAFISSCHQDKTDYSKKAVTKTIIGTEMIVKNLDGYGIVGSYGDYLFLKENRDTSRLVVYQIEGDSLKYHKGLIDKGRGPREFYYVEYSWFGDTLYVSNSDPTGIKAIYGIPLDDMSKIEDRNRWSEYPIPGNDIMTGMSFAKYGEGRFVIAGGESETKQVFSMVDYNKKEVVPLKFWPADSTKGPLYSKQMVYMQSKLCSSGRQILYSNLYARYMFIATIRGDEFVETAKIYSHLPQYEVKPDGNIRYTEDGEDGILIYATQDYIFAQVGRTVSEVRESDTYKGYPRSYIDELEVYDWKGRFIDNYQTDRPFYSFAVSADNHHLYTLSMDLVSKELIVMRYDLF